MSLKSFIILDSHENETPQKPLPYLPGLDGLRALAVLAVLFYHADPEHLPGGFLGVEIFFVISGYLITTLLLAEWKDRGAIDLKGFWKRRARRLLPAVFLLIAATLAFTVAFLPDEVVGLRGDALAAIGYVTNWYLIFVHKSYFETIGRPSLLQHLWSLAVEEQFYLAWPLLLTVLLRWWRPRRVLAAVLTGAVLSTLLMAFLYQPDADPSRIYYGTDTRATGLLIGAALAFLLSPGEARSRLGCLVTFLLDVLGSAALVLLFAACVQIDEYQAFLYRGGFALVGLATLIAIAGIVYPGSHLNRSLLGREPLRWIGLRSYSIYLWHWPIFALTRPQLDVPLDGVPLLALRLALTFLLAELSYRFVETPMRTGALGRALEIWKQAEGRQRRQLGIRWGSAIATVIVFSVMLGESVVSAQAPLPPAYLSETLGIAGLDEMGTADAAIAKLVPSETATPMPVPATPTAVSPATPNPSPTPPSAAAPAIPLSCHATGPSGTTANASSQTRVFIIGDSVSLGAAGELKKAIGGTDIDAVVGRQVSAAIAVLQAWRTAGQLGSVVVVALGNNGTFSTGQFNQLMGVLAGVPRVVFVNVRVPRPWESPNNDVINQGISRFPNAVLVDWAAASANHPEFFWKDGVHLRPAGAQAYAALIAGCVNAP